MRAVQNDNSNSSTCCLDCGHPVALSDVLSTLGRCPECFPRARSWRPSTGVHIVARYSPGFASDLTSWETTIFGDGRLRQLISWYAPAYEGRRPETRHAVIDSSSLETLLETIAAIDRLGIAQLNQHFCITDTENVVITAPSIGFHASIAPWTFAYFAAGEEVPSHALAGLATFRAAWDAIDAISPYTIAEHWQSRDSDDD